MSTSSIKLTFQNIEKDPRHAARTRLDYQWDNDDADGAVSREYAEDLTNWRTLLVATAFKLLPPQKTPVEIGKGIAFIVKRSMIRNQWRERMEEPDHEFEAFSSEFFDKRGYFSKHQHSTQQGSGIFGSELGNGDLLYIQSVHVSEDHRHQGLGRRLVEGLQAMADQENVPLSFCWPTDPDGKDDHAGPVSFMRSLEYRRVGLSPFFCRSSDPNHASRMLDASEDVNPANPWEGITPEQIQERFPVHSMMMNTPRSKITEVLRKLPANTNWRLADPSGRTLLHMAAMQQCPEAVIFLLSQIHVPKDLETTDINGVTPLAILFSATFHPKNCDDEFGLYQAASWAGMSNDSVESMKILSAAMGRPWNLDIEKRARFGCTCGACIEGYLSPRLQNDLSNSAAAAATYLEEGGEFENVPAWKIFVVFPSSLQGYQYSSEYIG